MDKEKDVLKCSICNENVGNYAIHTEYYSLIEQNNEIGNLGGFTCHKCAVKKSGINKLYHISNSCDIIKEFSLRIPKNRVDGEDFSTPRVSLATTIEGCLTAVPWAGSNIEQLYFGDYESTFLIRVYEFDVSNLDIENIIPPEYLYFSDSVRDAHVTKEHWYIGENLKPSRTYLIEINNDYEKSHDSIVCKNMMNYLRSEDMDYDELMEGCFSSVEDIEYQIIPEERRSGLFRLNHEITGVSLDDLRGIQIDIYDLYALEDTWVKLEKIGDRVLIKGEIDTRWTGNLDYSGEVDSEKMIEYINQNLEKGEILNV